MIEPNVYMLSASSMLIAGILLGWFAKDRYPGNEDNKSENKIWNDGYDRGYRIGYREGEKSILKKITSMKFE